MTATRRAFLAQAAMAGGALAAWPDGVRSAARSQFAPSRTPRRALRVLILGGTNFIGPHLVRDLLEGGHTVSIFTRGRRSPAIHPELFDRVEHLEGDRDGDLGSLAGKRWDAVIDNSGQRVEWARTSAMLLAGSVRLYMYVSSTGVFLPYRTTNISEDGPVLLADDPPQDPPSYGVMKAVSENEVRKAFPSGAIIVRPTYIVGPGDSTDRFPYWPVRIAQGGEVLVPGRMSDPVQYIDVRDLSAFMIQLIEQGTTGTFNVAGPHGRQSMAEFIYGVRAATTAETTWTWIEDYEFLEQQRLRFAIPWLMLTPDYLGSAQISNARAIAAGLRFRSLADTVEAILAWWASGAVPEERRASPRFVLTRDREREILDAWKGRRG
ncbi:MAG: NAD-dependent epimerase/dehydratase family protein [Gemmatimonadetes bacterium]|nr:NAD-dependent epimerase/dehydratase family protein [Gemmatimonadota bacterium]